MMDVRRENAIIALYTVSHSRDFHLPTQRPENKNGKPPARVRVRACTGNYFGSSKSMEAQCTIYALEQLGKVGRDLIYVFVADKDGELRKLVQEYVEIKDLLIRVLPRYYAKTARKKRMQLVRKSQGLDQFRNSTSM